MPFDLLFSTTFLSGPAPEVPVPAQPGDFQRLSFANPAAPTLAEVERLFRERWHTVPDWVTRGEAAPNGTIGPGNVPAGFTHDGGNLVVTLPRSATFTGDIEGYDFGNYRLRIEGTVTGSIRNNRWVQTAFSKAQIGAAASSGAMTLQRNEPIWVHSDGAGAATIAGGIRHNQFIGCGFGGPPAAILGRPATGGNHSVVGPIEFNSFLRLAQDQVKCTWSGAVRGNYFDAQVVLPPWAEQHVPGKTYVLGDVVYGTAGTTAARIRVCRVASTTTTPNFSGNTASAAWAWYDPHTDIETPFMGPQGETLEHVGNVYNLDGTHRRWLSGEPLGLGQNSSIRMFVNVTGQDMCSHDIHHNLFLDDVELKFNGAFHIGIAPLSDFHGTGTVAIRNNWYQSAGLTNDGGAHVTVANNVPGWTFPAAATLSGITAIHGRNTGTLAYQFTASRGGWMRVVVNGSASALTASQIKAAAVGTGGVLAVFDIDAEADEAALGFVDLSLSTGQVVHVHGLYQAGGGVNTIAAVRTVTEGAGTVNTFSQTALAFDGYVFDRNGSDFCPVVFAGQGRAGDQVQVRGTSAGGNTAWHKTFVRADGTWSATAKVPLAEWGNWYVPQARLGASGTILSGANTFGCGDVIAFLGQSELQRSYAPRADFSGALPKQLAAENITIVSDVDDNPTPAISVTRATAANMGTGVNVGALANANAFGHVLPNRKIMLVELCHSGTSPFSLWDDTSSARTWSAMMAIVDLVRASGSDFGGVVMNWYNAPASTIADMLANWAPGMMGILASGATFPLGTTHTTAPGSDARVRHDHCFWDHTADPDARGRGIFARNRTKLHLMQPMPFHNQDSGEDTAFDETRRMTNAERAGVLAFAADARVQTFLHPQGAGPGTHLADFSQENDGVQGIHPNRQIALGTPWFANQHLPALLRQAGVTVGEPRITGTEVINATTVDVIVSLPNGGTLTTLAALLSIAVPANDPPHRQAVTGFQISRSAGTKRPIYKTSATSFPSLYRGTVTIHDTGSGSGAGRTGRVRIVLSDAIATGDRLTWLDGQANAKLVIPRDDTAMLFHWMLMETVPTWRNGAALYPFHGVPVRPQTVMATLTAG